MSDIEQFDDEQDNTGSRIAWFFTGALIGATVAVLLAPKSGSDTRQLIADKTTKGKEAASAAGDNIVEASRDLFEKGRKLVDDAADLFERGRKIVRG